MAIDNRSREELLAEIENLRYRLEEAEETLHAIQTGAVDALVVSRPEGERIFTLQGADYSYRVLVETMNEGAATLSPDGVILYCNNRLAAMLHLPLEKLIGTRLVSYVAPIDHALFAARLEMCSVECDAEEISLITVEKNSLPVLFSCCTLELTGAPGIGVVLTDISYQKQAEARVREAEFQARMAEERERATEALRESERKYRELFESIDEGFCIIEVLFDERLRPVDYRFVEVNPAFERQTGLVNACGRTMRELVPALEEHWFEMYGRIALTGEPVRFQNEAAQLGRWYDVYAWRYSAPEDRQVAIIFNDITERKQTENDLKELNEELERRVDERTAELREKDQLLLVQGRQAAMGEMIGSIAHQWRQPLNSLGLAIQQLLLFYDSGDFDRAFLEKNVATSMGLVKHMSTTIEDFRNYFKPDKEKAEFTLIDTIAKTLALVEDSFTSKLIEIKVEAKDDPVIYGYRNEFAQALLNILNNARDALTEREVSDPTVTITIESEAGRAVVTIADNAGGIPEEIMDKIFNPYFTTKGPQEGTGVGLYMSKAIIEKHMGGKLSARNTARGAEFRIVV